MPLDDEPVLGPDSQGASSDDADSMPLVHRIRRLVSTQPFAVLCTHGEGHAYGSLVAFAFADDLRTAVFATPITTRKYRLLTEHDRVALVVDDRPDRQMDMMQVEAITATGRAREIPKQDALFERCAALLVARHSQLKGFVVADTSALFQIEIIRFFHVVRFQEVQQWVPAERP